MKKNLMVTITVSVNISAGDMYEGDAKFTATLPYDQLDYISPAAWLLADLKLNAVKEFEHMNSEERNK